jgi:PPOX class probable F420-dependent enzyme
MEDVRRLAALDNGLATVVSHRADGTARATVVNAGVIDHPVSGAAVAAFVARPGTRKLADLRARPRAALQWRAGWAWVSLEGDVELIGPDDSAEGIDPERLRLLLREVYTAAGGAHDDWAEYDRAMAAERRVVAIVAPARIYANP